MDNYVKTIKNKNVVNASMQEGESPKKNTSYLKEDVKSKPHISISKKANRIGTAQIKVFSQVRAQSQLKLLAERLDGDVKAQAFLQKQ